MISAKRVLAVGAHPDDLEFSCLGFLMRLRDLGAELTLYIASNGSAGDPTSSEARLSESRLALEGIGTTLLWENQSGIRQSDHERIAVRLREIILMKRPDLLLVHSEHDTHQEHRYLRDIVFTASRRHPCSILTYKSVSANAAYRENVFVDVSERLAEKIARIRMHQTQWHHEYMQEDYIRQFHTSWFARMRGCEFVESYSLEQGML